MELNSNSDLKHAEKNLASISPSDLTLSQLPFTNFYVFLFLDADVRKAGV